MQSLPIVREQENDDFYLPVSRPVCNPIADNCQMLLLLGSYGLGQGKGHKFPPPGELSPLLARPTLPSITSGLGNRHWEGLKDTEFRISFPSDEK